MSWRSNLWNSLVKFFISPLNWYILALQRWKSRSELLWLSFRRYATDLCEVPSIFSSFDILPLLTNYISSILYYNHISLLFWLILALPCSISVVFGFPILQEPSQMLHCPNERCYLRCRNNCELGWDGYDRQTGPAALVWVEAICHLSSILIDMVSTLCVIHCLISSFVQT